MADSPELIEYFAAHRDEPSGVYDWRMKHTKINPKYRVWSKEYKRAQDAARKIQDQVDALIGAYTDENIAKRDRLQAELIQANRVVTLIRERAPVPRVYKLNERQRTQLRSIEAMSQKFGAGNWETKGPSTEALRRLNLFNASGLTPAGKLALKYKSNGDLA